MDVQLKPTYWKQPCGIGLAPFYPSKGPKPLIIIGDKWDISEEIIEQSIVGLLSHETVEFLIFKFQGPSHPVYVQDLPNIHNLIGENQQIVDYVENTNGIVILLSPLT